MKRKERIDRGIKARCDDIFALSSYREILYLVLPRALPIIILFSFPLITGLSGSYYEKVIVITCTIGLLALSWDLMASVGLFSLGQAFFFGVGAYLTAYINMKLGLKPLFSMSLGTILGALFSTVLLIPVLRLRGVYFSIVTLTLPLLLARIIEATKILGGTEGLTALTPFENRWIEVYLPILAFFVTLFGFRRLINSDYGIVLQGIRDNDRAVLASGINIQWYKTQCVFLASLVACFSGSFMTHFYQATGLSAFALDYSLLPLASAVLGGVGTFAGPAIGSFILIPLSEFLRAFGTLRVVFYSIILFVTIIALPEGLFPFIRRKYHQIERIVEV
ncbi:MAG: branched-chain amino acid ABC transporter permease [Deltaproteobacteria bacterium]|nr:branched-chain amino acid ABC transporter permease [Deltaproteobacteria bacterium]